MNGLTPQQRQAIKTWTEERDELRREIGVLTTERDERKKEVEEQGAALTDLHTQIAEARGRISEMDALEQRFKNSLATDVAQLMERKSRLESEIETKEAELKAVSDKHVVVVAAIGELSKAHEVIKGQAATVDDIVANVAETSNQYLAEAKVLIESVRSIATEVIEKGNENVRQTGIVLEKLPRYVFELQKPIPIRRAYAMPRDLKIEPDKKPLE